MITHQNLKIWKMLETDLSHLKCMISRPVTITWVLSRPTWAIFKVIGMHMLTLVPGSYLSQFLLGMCCWSLRAPTPFYSSPAKFSPIFIGLNWSRDAIVFILGGPLSAHSARPPKRKFDVLKTNICKYASFKNIKFPRGNYQTDSSET